MPGSTSRPRTSMTSLALVGRISGCTAAILPLRIATSITPLRPEAGQITCPPRSSRSNCGSDMRGSVSGRIGSLQHTRGRASFSSTPCVRETPDRQALVAYQGQALSGLGIGQRRQDARRRDRNLAKLDPVMVQCIVDRIGDGGGGADRAALADTLLPELGIGR